MQNNIQLENERIQKEKEFEASRSHLVNTKEIILMDQLEKIRLD